MKKILLLLILSVAIKTFCSAQNKVHLLTAAEKRNYVLSIDQTKIANSSEEGLNYPPYDCKKYRYMSIPLKLTNNSNDTLKYITMSCSWQDIYGTNSKNIEVLMSACDKNVLTKKMLRPHKSMITYIPIRIIKMARWSNTNFKVSMNVCRDMGQNSFGIEMLDLSVVANNIWSNEVKLPLSK
jgi:hypothetical protein